jgi:hypothetical protein
VVDVRFEAGKDLPNIYDALHITRPDGSGAGIGRPSSSPVRTPCARYPWRARTACSAW